MTTKAEQFAKDFAANEDKRLELSRRAQALRLARPEIDLRTADSYNAIHTASVTPDGDCSFSVQGGAEYFLTPEQAIAMAEWILDHFKERLI